MSNASNKTGKEPKIELKNVKTFRGMEGYGLNATLYVDGIKTAFVIDDANGGPVDYEIFNKAKFDEIKAYAASLPAEPIVFDGVPALDEKNQPMTIQPDVDTLVDKAFNLIQRAKEQKKIEKKMETCVMWGIPGADAYHEVKWSAPLSKIPVARLQQSINKYMAQFQPGEQFLNTNLKKLGLITYKFDMSDVTNTGEWEVTRDGDKWEVVRNHDTSSAPAADAVDQSPCAGLRTETQGVYDSKAEANEVLAKVKANII
jgi:hypothetical protein